MAAKEAKLACVLARHLYAVADTANGGYLFAGKRGRILKMLPSQSRRLPSVSCAVLHAREAAALAPSVTVR